MSGKQIKLFLVDGGRLGHPGTLVVQRAHRLDLQRRPDLRRVGEPRRPLSQRTAERRDRNAARGHASGGRCRGIGLPRPGDRGLEAEPCGGDRERTSLS